MNPKCMHAPEMLDVLWERHAFVSDNVAVAMVMDKRHFEAAFAEAREAGRREGLQEACAAECAWCKLRSPAVLKGGIWQHLEEHDLSAGTCRAWRIRALIDSPKAEGEETK